MNRYRTTRENSIYQRKIAFRDLIAKGYFIFGFYLYNIYIYCYIIYILPSSFWLLPRLHQIPNVVFFDLPVRSFEPTTYYQRLRLLMISQICERYQLGVVERETVIRQLTYPPFAAEWRCDQLVTTFTRQHQLIADKTQP